MEFKYNRYNTSWTPLSSLLVFANISYYPLHIYNLPAIFLVDSFFCNILWHLLRLLVRQELLRIKGGAVQNAQPHPLYAIKVFTSRSADYPQGNPVALVQRRQDCAGEVVCSQLRSHDRGFIDLIVDYDLSSAHQRCGGIEVVLQLLVLSVENVTQAEFLHGDGGKNLIDCVFPLDWRVNVGKAG